MYKLINWFDTTLLSTIPNNTETGSFRVKEVWVSWQSLPTDKVFYLVVNLQDEQRREIFRIWKVVGNELFYDLRVSPNGKFSHLVGDWVSMNDVAETINDLADKTNWFWYILRKWGLAVEVIGWQIENAIGKDIVVANTGLTLLDNKTNYIYYDYKDNKIKNSEYKKIEARTIAIIKTANGKIASVEYPKSFQMGIGMTPLSLSQTEISALDTTKVLPGTVIFNTTTGQSVRLEWGSWISYAAVGWGGSVVNATDSVAGKVKLATSTDITNWTNTSWDWSPLVVQPSALSGITSIAEWAILTGYYDAIVKPNTRSGIYYPTVGDATHDGKKRILVLPGTYNETKYWKDIQLVDWIDTSNRPVINMNFNADANWYIRPGVLNYDTLWIWSSISSVLESFDKTKPFDEISWIPKIRNLSVNIDCSNWTTPDSCVFSSPSQEAKKFYWLGIENSTFEFDSTSTLNVPLLRNVNIYVKQSVFNIKDNKDLSYTSFIDNIPTQWSYSWIVQALKWAVMKSRWRKNSFSFLVLSDKVRQDFGSFVSWYTLNPVIWGHGFSGSVDFKNLVYVYWATVWLFPKASWSRADITNGVANISDVSSFSTLGNPTKLDLRKSWFKIQGGYITANYYMYYWDAEWLPFENFSFGQDKIVKLNIKKDPVRDYVNTFTFTNCTFSNTSNSWSYIITIPWMNLQFINCKFNWWDIKISCSEWTANVNFYWCWTDNSNTPTNLWFQNCTWYWYWMWWKPGTLSWSFIQK